MKLEPVAWILRSKTGLIRCAMTDAPSEETREITKLDGDTITPLYAIPPGYKLVPVEQAKDGERFAWLRNQTGSIFVNGHTIAGQFEGQQGLFNEFIDAAMIEGEQ